MFSYHTSLKLRDTDAAGVAFFASYLSIAHEAYEAALSAQGVGLAYWLKETHLPIVKSEAEYHAPISLGCSLCLRLGYVRLGARSFTLKSNFYMDQGGEWTSAGWVKTVHVAVLRGDSTPLPDALRVALHQIGEYEVKEERPPLSTPSLSHS